MWGKILAFLAALFGGVLSAVIEFLAKQGAARIIFFTAFLVTLGLMLNSIYSLIHGQMNNFAGNIPVITEFYNALVPANLAVAVTVFVTVEIGLAAFRWKYTLLKTKYKSTVR